MRHGQGTRLREAEVMRRMTGRLVERELAGMVLDELAEVARGERIVLPLTAQELEADGVPRAVARAIEAAMPVLARALARASVQMGEAEPEPAARAVVVIVAQDAEGFGCGNPNCEECSTRLV